MNCKPGDLAVTTGMFVSANNDVIVEVESIAFVNSQGITVWNIKHRKPMLVDVGRQAGMWVSNGIICDTNLRPISGVPVHDEQFDKVSVSCN